MSCLPLDAINLKKEIKDIPRCVPGEQKQILVGTMVALPSRHRHTHTCRSAGGEHSILRVVLYLLVGSTSTQSVVVRLFARPSGTLQRGPTAWKNPPHRTAPAGAHQLDGW